MTKIGLLVSVLIITACSTYPDNLEGKRFDANTSYCQGLWRGANSMYQSRPKPPLQSGANSPAGSYGPQYISQLERERIKYAYSKDCESVSAYNSRVIAESK